MPSYSYDFRKAEKRAGSLHHIRICMPSEENGNKHIIEHHFDNTKRPDRYGFQKQGGPELVRFLQDSIGRNDLGKAEGEGSNTEKDA